MRLKNSFEVPASPEQTWALLNDVPRVVPCMPGAELTEVVDENTFKATMHVKLGPMSLQFATDVVREAVDEAARKTTLSTKARELKGRGSASATIESSLEPSGAGTKVLIVTELQLQGAVAQFGRGVVPDVANQLITRFAACLAGQLQEQAAPADGGGEAAPTADGASPPAPPPTAAPVVPVGGFGLVFRALGAKIASMFHRK